MSAVVAEVEIAFDEDDDVFMISTKSESELVSRYTWRIWLTALGIVACGTLLPMVIYGAVNQDFGNAAAATWGWMILTGIGSLGLTMLMYVVLVFNGLVSTQQRLLRAWSLIDIQLKRRYDLIVNLVKVCQAYTEHEKATLQLVARARAEGGAVSEMPSAAEVQAGEKATQVQQVVIQWRICRMRLRKLKTAWQSPARSIMKPPETTILGFAVYLKSGLPRCSDINGRFFMQWILCKRRTLMSLYC